ncbi:DUF3558 domain-containing protein [Kutzneria sp. NPDC052558]|uniref:DUF3558 domain-containing protein n=1 Tax=Kutzneria sp. NPDC052558 TaxID=3364121 RepID=UPI0037C6C7D4
MRRPDLLAVVTAGVALVVAGCGAPASGTASPATGGGTSTSPTTSAAPQLDVCAVLPQDVLASMGLTNAPKKLGPNDCEWSALNADVVATSLEQYALGQRPTSGAFNPTSSPLTLGGHKALQLKDDSAAICGVDIALASDITFTVLVTAQDSKTYPAACDHAKALAAGAEPKLPLVS